MQLQKNYALSSLATTLISDSPIFKSLGLPGILLAKKGIYPYDYIDSMERFNEIELPAKPAFRSMLNNTEIFDEDYAHSKIYGQN